MLVIVIIVFVWLVMVVPWVHAQYLLLIGAHFKSIVKGLMA